MNICFKNPWFRIILSAAVLLLPSCKDRGSSLFSAESDALPLPDLTGDYLGFIENPTVGKKRAVRLYFKKLSEGSQGYNVAIVEYPKILGVAPQFVATPQPDDEGSQLELKTWLNALLGDLQHILARVTVYRATIVPGQTGQFSLKQIRVDPKSGNLLVNNAPNPSILSLDPQQMLESQDRLAGATITASNVGEPGPVTFPKKNLGSGLEYLLVKTAYKVANLKSSWRDRFLTGRYLSTYGNVDKHILTLSRGNGLGANFVDPKTNNVKIEEFTNPESFEVVGDYKVTDSSRGIFTFQAKSTDSKGREHVEHRMGLFIDVFDASESLNLDVVELVMVDADNSSKFLMYFEDPTNGEGN